MKFLKIIMLIGLSVLILTSCKGKESEKNILYVGTNAEFSPFEYLEGDNIVGFDIELIKEIGKVIDMEVKVQDMTFSGLLPALQSKKVDLIIAGMTETEERKKAVNFTSSYFTAKQVIIVAEEDESINSFDDLVGKKVGVMLGFTGDLVVSEMEGVTVERFDAAVAAIMALDNDKLDAVVLDSEPASRYIETYENLKISEAPAEEENYAMAIRKDDSELLEKIEKGLKEVISNGTYDKLISKYF